MATFAYVVGVDINMASGIRSVQSYVGTSPCSAWTTSSSGCVMQFSPRIYSINCLKKHVCYFGNIDIGRALGGRAGERRLDVLHLEVSRHL